MLHAKIDLVDTISIALATDALDEDERRCLQDFMAWRSTAHPLIVVPIIELISHEEAESK